MKRIVILLFTVIITLPAYSQSSLQDGDRCFERGDYTCAEAKYNDAFRLTSGQNKRIAEIKRDRAKECTAFIKTANNAFANKNYRVAKENYQKVLELNPKDEYVKNQLDKCDDLLKPPAVTLSASKTSLSFSSSGGSESVTVATNASSYSVNNLPPWCTVQKNTGSFKITCNSNSGSTTRTGHFTVTAEDKTVRINVSQSGMRNTQGTTLSVSEERLSFSSSGGRSEEIEVYSNADTYSILYVPSWCSVRMYDGYFVVSCDANYSGQTRSNWFAVVAGGKEVKVYINQTSTTRRSSAYTHTYTRNKANVCFNCPKTKDTWGLTLGYVQKAFYSSYLDGIQFGLRIEPLFKHGFGLNTGLLFEYYSNDLYYYDSGYGSGSYANEVNSELYALNVPLHLEYRLNFSKWFNIFAYGGVGFNFVTSSKYSGEYSLPATFEYGCGVRINHVQFNMGKSSLIGDFKDIKSFDDNLIPYQNLVISASYMF